MWGVVLTACVVFFSLSGAFRPQKAFNVKNHPAEDRVLYIALVPNLPYQVSVSTPVHCLLILVCVSICVYVSHLWLAVAPLSLPTYGIVYSVSLCYTLV